MRKRSKRLCSLLMALVMALSLLPTAVFAAEPAEQTYVKVTQKEELVTGKYVLVASNGYALGALDGTWITAVQPTVNEDKIVNPESGVWTLTVGKDGVQLTDAAGKTVAPSGSNNNGIKNAEYNWAVEFADGKFQFKGTGDDTVTLASNEKSGNKFRAYKNTTASGYPHEFTLYKLETAEQEKVATPTANVADGAEIEVGTKIEFSCTTEGAKLYYKTAGTEYQEYTGAIEATQIETYTVKATKDGMAVCFDENDARVMGRTARGVRGIRLEDGDRVVGVALVEEGKKLLTVTEQGFGKRSEFREFSVHNRGGKGVRCHNLSDKTGRLVGVLSVEEEDDLLLVSKEGVIIRVSVSDIPVYSRSAGGVIVMRMSGDNKVVNCTVVKKKEAAPEGGEGHPDAAEQTPAGETEEAEDKE